MPQYDVIIAGAGPAGCQCARELAYAGIKVLLIDKLKGFYVNNYSSGGAPLSICRDFSLPDALIGSAWNKLQIAVAEDREMWESKEIKGVILDFQKLKTFLAGEVLKHGGQVLHHTRYEGHEKTASHVYVKVRHLKGPEDEILKCRVLVDATGTDRAVFQSRSENGFKAAGIEYLLKAAVSDYDRFASTLSFFLGLKWMPQGYGWIFPMEKPFLKIGVIRYFENKRFVPYAPSHAFYLEQLIKENLASSEPQIIDKHGKTIFYRYGRNDPHTDGPIISIGDAVSTFNPLAAEGIRHAMQSANLATNHILKYLSGSASNLNGYQSEMNKTFNFRWKLCEYVARQAYQTKTEREFTKMLKSFRQFSLDEIFELAFDYKASKILKFLWHYKLKL